MAVAGAVAERPVATPTLPTLAQVEQEIGRRSLLGFTEYTHPFYQTNWHHKVVADALDRVLDGRCRRLMIFMPPQNGKSELVSRRFPAYAFGKRPDVRLVATSYAASLAEDMSRDVQRIMESPEYRQVFPRTRLASSKGEEIKTATQFRIVGRHGAYHAAGVGGSVTGKTFDIGLIDDPVKNRQDAESETYRKGVWDWYTSTFYTRQFGDQGAIVILMTRWHEDDLAGRLLAQQKAGGEFADQWEVIALPAINEQGPNAYDPRQPGDPLWPSKYPLGELAKRKALSSYDWSSLYQQHPTPIEGGLIKRAWFQWTRELPKRLDEIVISLDAALRTKQTNDFSALQAWGQKGPDTFSLLLKRDRWALNDLVREVLQMHKWTKKTWVHTPVSVVIENAGAGPEAIAEVRRVIPGVMTENPTGDKRQRVHAVLPILEGRNVWLLGAALPDGRVDETLSPAWIAPFVEECAGFPFGAHDDQVDALTQSLRRLHRPRKSAGFTDIKGL